MSTLLALVGYGEYLVFIVLVFASILAVAVFMERAIIFRKNSNKKITRFAEELIKILRKRDFKAAAELVKESGENAYTRFARFSIRTSSALATRVS